jgi:predicted permease
MDTLLADIRQALRQLKRSPGFALAAIGVLALGLAANTAVFSVADAVLFRPLAFDRPGELVTISEVILQFSNLYPRLPVNSMHFLEWQTRTRSFAEMALLRDLTLNLTGQDGPPERLGAERVTANLLPALGVRPALGRNFTTEEDRPNNDREVILTDSLWRRRFHGDGSIVNKIIMLNGTPHVVVGVLPPSFRFPRPDLLSALGGSSLNVELFKPLALDRTKLDKVGNHNYTAIARLRPGVTREQALAELNTVQRALTKELATPGMDLRADVSTLQEQIVSGSRRGLLVLLASIAMVLLIMCVNLGNLMLARATARSREMAVRSALGAGSWRLVRQVLTESLSISLAGGLAGLGLAYVAVRALVAAAPIDLPRLDEVHMDLRALLFAFVTAILSGLLFGLIPAWRASRSQPQDALRTGGRSTTQSRHGLRVSEILVSAEVALSAALLVAAGLLVGSLIRVLKVDQGFHPDNVLTVSLTLPGARYPENHQRTAFFDRVLPAVQQVPGVRSAGLITTLPLQGDTWVDMITRDDDRRPVAQRPVANYRFVSPEYFTAMEIPIRQGRGFEPADRTREVVMVSATTAARIWPGQNAIGKHMHRGNDSDPFWEVIGVATDTRANMKNDQPLTVYLPYWKQSESTVSLVIRTAQEPASTASAVRKIIWSIDSEVPVPEMKTMQQVVSGSVSERRFQTELLVGFALAALILASLGIYGVISYSVNRRSNEIGIRMALGAQAGDVSGMVLRQGMRPVAIGLVVGIASALALSRLLQSLLFEMKATDPWVLAGVMFLLTATAAAACYAPAIRATKVDPAIALRDE